MDARVAPVEPTVTPQFTQALLQSAARRGIVVPEPLARELDDGNRVALSAQDRLWAHLCAHANEPLFGLELGLSLQVGHLDTAGMLLMSSSTVGDAVDALLEYHPIVGEGGRFELLRDGARCTLIYRPRYVTCCSERVEAVMGCLLNLARWTTGGAFQASAIRFVHAPLAHRSRYEQRLGVPVTFRAARNALCLDTASLALPLSQANPDLRRHLQRLAADELDALDRNCITARVRHLLALHPHWARDRVAGDMNMSVRHLVRRLGAEGTSFKRLHDDLRQRFAERALRDNARIGDVAYCLGFADADAFARAFRRWAGVTPARYRDASRASGRNDAIDG